MAEPRTNDYVRDTDSNVTSGWVEDEIIRRKDAALADRALWRDYYFFMQRWADIRLLGNKVTFGNLRPAHAMTSHKSQGSTFRSVLVDAVDIMRQPDRRTALASLYVAVSRASKSVCVRIKG